MQFMTSLFGGTTNTLLNSAFALGIVLVGIVLGLWGLKLLTKAGGNLGRGRNKRLVVVDTATVDSKRQIVIIRRDNVEHVIMTGGPQDLIIESGVPVAEPAPLQPRRTPQRPSRPAPAAAQNPSSDIDRPTAPERPVSREAVDRLRDLARPAPLKPRQGASPRHTNLLRPVMEARDERVIPIGPALRVDNSAGPASDSVKTAPVEAGGQTRFVGRNRFFRSITRGEGK